MFCSRHHIQRLQVKETKFLDTVPPGLLIYATAEVLFNLSRADDFCLSFKNVCKARVAASSSRQFTCHVVSCIVQGPPMLIP